MKHPHISITAPQARQDRSLERLLGSIKLIILLGLTVTFLLSSLSYAKAASLPAPDVALLPQAPLMPQAPLTLNASCDGTVIVFTARNNVTRWVGRGEIRVTDTASGHVLRTRHLALDEGQTATFRVSGDEVKSGRYRLSVGMADGLMTYVKSFTGHCRPHDESLRTAQR